MSAPPDAALEAEIAWASLMLATARTPAERRAAWNDLCALEEERDVARDRERGEGGTAGPHELRSLSREMILQFIANPDVSLGGGYRAYPGISAAQIRKNHDMGW